MVTVVGKNPGIVKVVNFTSCASILEYTPSEVKKGTFNGDYLGDYDIFPYIDCPCCSSRVIVKKY